MKWTVAWLLPVPLAFAQEQHRFTLRDTDDIRNISIGQINFLHTTDTHGWLGSHTNQPDYDADWGDFYTFAKRLVSQRLDASQDLLLIDTGDKIDGNGLSDATQPRGTESTRIFNEMDYDLLTLGNHELYRPESTYWEYYMTAQSDKFKHKYVSSNVEFIKRDGEVVPFGNKYVYFQTPKSRTRILAFSFMFDFERSNERAIVTPALQEITSKEWFNETIQRYPPEKIDLIIIFGHLPVTDTAKQEINQLHSILRYHYPDKLIQYFGGHTHIRDFVVFDNKSTALQSGRFAETVGFLSIDNVTAPNPSFHRRYIDFSKRSFAYHLGEQHVLPQTSKGASISKQINKLRQDLELDHQYGTVLSTYYMNARPITSNESLYNLLVENVLPRLVPKFGYDSTISRFIMMNTGSVRYDLYKGPFTKDTEYTVLPFENEWKYVIIPMWVATRIEAKLNDGPTILDLLPPGLNFQRPEYCEFVWEPSLTEGFTTRDDFGCHGDDTKHNTRRVYTIPNVVQSLQINGETSEETLVHFVFYTFLQPSVIKAINEITNSLNEYTDADCYLYGGKSAKRLLREYIMENSSTIAQV